MKLKQITVGVALAVSALAANAVDLDFGTDPMSFGYVATVATNTVFFDTYAFALSGGATVDATAFALSGIKSGASWSLFEVGSPDDLFLGGWGLSPAGNPVLTLDAGSYYFTVGGKSAAASVGKYAIAATVTPVPEPETYAMMLAGLAAVGFLARRRQG